jgi:hypothetical protein
MLEKSAVSVSEGAHGVNGKMIVRLEDSFATNVSCNILNYLSTKGIRTYFIDKQDSTSFRALHCIPSGIVAVVKTEIGYADAYRVDIFHQNNISPSPSFAEDEKKARSLAVDAFNALRCAFKKKTEVELRMLDLEFGKVTSGYLVGKLIIACAITSRECQVSSMKSLKKLKNNDFQLSFLTNKLFS